MKVSSVQFLIVTSGNHAGVTRTIKSIISKYPSATIVVGDSDRQLDRVFYKELRKELQADGMITRLIVQHLPYQSPLGAAFNELLKRTSSTYRVLLTDHDYLTDKTDIESMLAVISSDKKIGVVSGSVNTPARLEKKSESNGVKYDEVKAVSRFMIVQGDVRHFIRFDEKSDQPESEFSKRAATRLPYKMVQVESVIMSDDKFKDETTETTDGDGGGETPELDISTEAGGSDTEDGSDDTRASERKNETSEDTVTRRRSSRGGTR